jgi:hypothetical protein
MTLLQSQRSPSADSGQCLSPGDSVAAGSIPPSAERRGGIAAACSGARLGRRGVGPTLGTGHRRGAGDECAAARAPLHGPPQRSE